MEAAELTTLRHQRDELVRRVLLASSSQPTAITTSTFTRPTGHTLQSIDDTHKHHSHPLTQDDVKRALHLAQNRSSNPTAHSPTAHNQTPPPQTKTISGCTDDIRAHRITALTRYNEIKDVAQMLIGILADQRACRVLDVMRELDVADDD